jgi:hypothetical protein
MASSVDDKLLKSTKFPPEFNQKVDMQKVNIEVMKKYDTARLRGLRPDSNLRVADGLQAGFLRYWAMKTTWLSSSASIYSRARATSVSIHQMFQCACLLCLSRRSNNSKSSSLDSSRRIPPTSARNCGHYALVPNRTHKVCRRNYWKRRSKSSNKKRYFLLLAVLWNLLIAWIVGG